MIPDDANAIKDSIDAKLGRRYQFEMFENFERCADVSKQEAHIIDLFLSCSNFFNCYLCPQKNPGVTVRAVTLN